MDMLPVVGVGGGGEESDSESGFSAECLARMAEARERNRKKRLREERKSALKNRKKTTRRTRPETVSLEDVRATLKNGEMLVDSVLNENHWTKCIIRKLGLLVDGEAMPHTLSVRVPGTNDTAELTVSPKGQVFVPTAKTKGWHEIQRVAFVRRRSEERSPGVPIVDFYSVEPEAGARPPRPPLPPRPETVTLENVRKTAEEGSDATIVDSVVDPSGRTTRVMRKLGLVGDGVAMPRTLRVRIPGTNDTAELAVNREGRVTISRAKAKGWHEIQRVAFVRRRSEEREGSSGVPIVDFYSVEPQAAA